MIAQFSRVLQMMTQIMFLQRNKKNICLDISLFYVRALGPHILPFLLIGISKFRLTISKFRNNTSKFRLNLKFQLKVILGLQFHSRDLMSKF